MKSFRNISFVSILVFVFLLSAVGIVMAEEDSHIVGRLFGSTQPLPGLFRGDTRLMANNVYPEFLGYRFVNSQSGKKIKMRPDGKGYFFKSLEPGTWTFERLRNDRPGGDEGSKVLEIMTFDVPAGALVNLGTIIIVVDGKPTERLRIKKNYEEGTYVYTYRYARSDSADDNTWPLDNLKKKKPKILEKYKDNIIEVKDPVTTDLDSSKVLLRGAR